MLICGIHSLVDRRLSALCHMRCGPSIGSSNGLLLPLCDGVKLMCCIVVYDVVLSSTLVVVFVLSWYWSTVSVSFVAIHCVYIISVVFIIAGHLSVILIVVLYYGVSVFVSVSFVRLFVVSSIWDFSVVYSIGVLSMVSSSYVGLYCVVAIGFYMRVLSIAGIYGIAMGLLIVVIMASKLPYEFVESESELVCGLITECSGLSFMLLSVYEISGLFYWLYTIASLSFGGSHIGLHVCCLTICGIIIGCGIVGMLRLSGAVSFGIIMVVLVISVVSGIGVLHLF